MQRNENRSRKLPSAALLACIGWQFFIAGVAFAGQAPDVAKSPSSLDRTIVEAGDLRLVLEKAEQGLRIVSLTDTAANQELLGGDALPLFSVTVRDAKTKELLTIAADSGWRQVDVSRNDATESRKLTFAAPVDDRLKGLRIEVALDAEKAENAVTWDLQIVADNAQWGLWHVVFPQVLVKEPGEGGKVFLPQTAGIEVSNLWDTAGKKGGTYPSGWTCMQYMAAYNKARRTGLYLGVHDPFGSTKDIFAEGQPGKHAVVFRFDHPVPDMGKPGVDFDLPGKAKWQLLRGDWFDAAQIYRTWVSHEANWWPTLGPDGRADTPKWMRELPAWAMTGGSPSECVPQLTAFAQELAVPTGFHWYNWHQIPFDNDYPHYFPPRDGFAEGVAELKKAGVYVMPYINGRLWDTRDKGAQDWDFTRVALAATTKDEAGNPYTESYGSKESDGSSVKLAAMCPSTSLWQDRVRETVLRLFSECGVSGVYIDQIAAAQPRLCFDASHGHALGGGHWWTQGVLEDARCDPRRQACRLHADDRVQRRALHQMVRWVPDVALARAEHGPGIPGSLRRGHPDVRARVPRRPEPGLGQSNESRTAIGVWRADRLVRPGCHQTPGQREVPARLHSTALAAEGVLLRRPHGPPAKADGTGPDRDGGLAMAWRMAHHYRRDHDRRMATSEPG
jgi:hypothetical protein